MYYWVISLFSIFIIVSAYVCGILLDNGKRMFLAMRFVAVVFVSIALIFSDTILNPSIYGERAHYYNDLLSIYVVHSLLFATAILMLLQSHRKYAIPIAWIIFSSVIALYFLNVLLYPGGATIFCPLFVIACGLGLLIAANVVRVKRMRRGEFIVDSSPDRKSKLLLSGNILSTISYIAFILVLKDLFLKIYYSSFQFGLPFFIITIVMAIICGSIAFALLHFARKNNDDLFTAMDKALYIWSWVIIVIAVIILVIMLIVVSMLGDSPSSDSGKREVTDENGKKHKLDYNGGTEEEVTDESGTVWVTKDAGNSYRKRDTYEYESDDGNTHYLQDESGQAQYTQGRASVLKDKKGNTYDTGLWGDVEKREWGSDSVHVGQIKESASVKADKVDE